MRELDEYDFKLLESLLTGDRYLHMGKTSVTAIQKAWEMQEMGLIGARNDDSSWLYLTDKGRKVIKERNRF